MQLFYNIYDKVQRKFYYLMFIVSVFSLSFAYFSDYVLGYHPCILCLYQRLPYYFIASGSIIAIFYRKFRILISFILTASFIISFGLSLYHTGIEKKMFPASKSCNKMASFSNYNNYMELEASLLNSKNASCEIPSFIILGFSMAELNAILSFIMLILTIFNTHKEIARVIVYEK